MSITLEGNNNRVRMNDGTYLDSNSGGNATSWVRINRITIQTGTVGMGPSGEVTVFFPIAFQSSAYRIIISEANAAGWGSDSVTIFGSNGWTNTYFGIRSARKYNGGDMYSPTGGATARWVAIGY